MSSGKSSGQARSDIETTGPGSEAASWSSDADAAPAIHDHMVSRRGDSHGPPEMMSDPDAHALKLQSYAEQPLAGVSRRMVAGLPSCPSPDRSADRDL